MNEETATKILQSVAARDGNPAGAGAVPQEPQVSAEQVTSTVSKVTEFVDKFVTIDASKFVFTPSDLATLSEIDNATKVLFLGTKGEQISVVSDIVFGPRDPVDKFGKSLQMWAQCIDILTHSIENMNKVAKEDYNSEIMLKCAKIRLQILQAIVAIGCTETAVSVVVARCRTPAQSSSAHVTSSLVAAVLHVIHAVSAKFDFVAVAAAVKLLRNWALHPDAVFRRTLIDRYDALSAVTKSFGHKDPNVAGACICTFRHFLIAGNSSSHASEVGGGGDSGDGLPAKFEALKYLVSILAK